MSGRSSRAARARALDRLLVLLQASLSVAEVQEAYLQGIVDVVWARGYGFYHLDPATLSMVRCAALVPRSAASLVDEYEVLGRDKDPVFLQSTGQGRAVDNTRILSTRDWERSAVYEVLTRARFWHSLEAPLHAGRHLVGTLNFARGPDDPPFADRDLACIELLGRHVEAALYRAVRHETLGQRAVLLEDALDALPQALLITRLDGTIVFSNRAADRLADPVGRPSERPSIVRAIRANVAQMERRGGRVALSAADADTAPGGVATSTARDNVLVKSVLLPGRQGLALSLLFRRAAANQLPLEWTPLSPREQELVEMVSRGLSTRQMAEIAYISENTVKEHLKRIFGKLQVRSRAELVQAVWQTGAGRAAALPADAAAPRRENPPDG